METIINVFIETDIVDVSYLALDLPTKNYNSASSSNQLYVRIDSKEITRNVSAKRGKKREYAASCCCDSRLNNQKCVHS